MPRALHQTAPAPDRAILVAADVPGALLPADESLNELAELARTAGAEVVARFTQRLDHPNPATYIGSGKVQEIVEAIREHGANVVIFDDELSPSQQRNLEKALGVKVIDRTALILDIFATRAQTREGRLQVELAQHQYLLPRLAGQWSHLERMEGAIGTRGPGETQIETDRRLIRNRIAKIRRDLEEVRTQRELYRRRRARNNVPVVALVGYTNAGKSTLMRALSGADVLAEDKLFATLDPVTRRISLPSGEIVLLTDTVGFIQKLPTQLVAAFRATLEELEDADLLLHVVDISHPNAYQHVQTVEATLRELGVDRKPQLLALNKVDLLRHEDGRPVADYDEARAIILGAGAPPRNVAIISAAKRWGLDLLRERIEEGLESGFENVELELPAVLSTAV
ncbi:GTPase HflX [Tepidiforma bonchosmolovskayae]|jgi:GTP-binding protein HflX|uniref:GTPase HflX n=1 Tax=Tepidiforma bonchosmolovskayae TaxID=2601677 RepID=A0ABX6C3T1_9CHLR|nr:GTPase HflX [Tepidiforma bonchosmolovskayae]QFG03892.1 GTPase HflX [Tepidiforma bonchosmolovskayae]